jgi:hypothetical protein
MNFFAGQTLLEVGCCETDFSAQMRNAGLAAVGIDPRATPDQGVAASAMTYEHDVPLDWVVMLGALEHFGLGYYGDPLDEDGDIKTIENVAETWLKPGGSVWFDVPFNPVPSVVENRHFRIYDHRAIETRLSHPNLIEIARLYCHHNVPPVEPVLCAEPVETRHPYHYICRWLMRKP